MRQRFCILVVLVAAATWSCDNSSTTSTTKQGDVAAAKAAMTSFHTACDEWATARREGRAVSVASRKITEAYFEFLKQIKNTRYTPNNEWLFPRELAFAGSYQDPDGGHWSYLVGKGQTGLRMSAWKRAEWSADELPGHGFAASISLEPTELFEKFHVSTATQPDLKAEVIIVPYTLADTAGTIELRRNGKQWSFSPDRGIVGALNWWRPFADAATRPAE
jgi:hypothetical protein